MRKINDDNEYTNKLEIQAEKLRQSKGYTVITKFINDTEIVFGDSKLILKAAFDKAKAALRVYERYEMKIISAAAAFYNCTIDHIKNYIHRGKGPDQTDPANQKGLQARHMPVRIPRAVLHTASCNPYFLADA